MYGKNNREKYNQKTIFNFAELILPLNRKIWLDHIQAKALKAH